MKPPASKPDPDGFIPDADGFAADAKPGPTPITPEDRHAWDLAAMQPWAKGQEIRAGIQDKYGGREAFMRLYDPKYAWVEENVVPPALEMGLSAGGAGLLTKAPWLQKAATAAEPAFTKYAVPALAKTAGKIGEGIEAVGPAAKKVLSGPVLKKALELLTGGTIGYEIAKATRGKE